MRTVYNRRARGVWLSAVRLRANVLTSTCMYAWTTRAQDNRPRKHVEELAKLIRVSALYESGVTVRHAPQSELTMVVGL